MADIPVGSLVLTLKTNLAGALADLQKLSEALSTIQKDITIKIKVPDISKLAKDVSKQIQDKIMIDLNKIKTKGTLNIGTANIENALATSVEKGVKKGKEKVKKIPIELSEQKPIKHTAISSDIQKKWAKDIKELEKQYPSLGTKRQPVGGSAVEEDVRKRGKKKEPIIPTIGVLGDTLAKVGDSAKATATNLKPLINANKLLIENAKKAAKETVPKVGGPKEAITAPVRKRKPTDIEELAPGAESMRLFYPTVTKAQTKRIKTKGVTAGELPTKFYSSKKAAEEKVGKEGSLFELELEKGLEDF